MAGESPLLTAEWSHPPSVKSARRKACALSSTLCAYQTCPAEGGATIKCIRAADTACRDDRSTLSIDGAVAADWSDAAFGEQIESAPVLAGRQVV